MTRTFIYIKLKKKNNFTFSFSSTDESTSTDGEDGSMEIPAAGEGSRQEAEKRKKEKEEKKKQREKEKMEKKLMRANRMLYQSHPKSARIATARNSRMNRLLQADITNIKDELGKIGEQRRDDLDRIHKNSVVNQERLEGMLKEVLVLRKQQELESIVESVTEG